MMAWPKEVIVETQKPGEGLLGRWNQWLLLKDWKEQRGKKGIRGHERKGTDTEKPTALL